MLSPPATDGASAMKDVDGLGNISIKWNLGQWNRRKTVYQQVIAMDPSDLYPCEFLSEAYVNGNMLEEGITFYNQQIALYPQEAVLYRHLAHLYTEISNLLKLRTPLAPTWKCGSDQLIPSRIFQGFLERGGNLEEPSGPPCWPRKRWLRRVHR